MEDKFSIIVIVLFIAAIIFSITYWVHSQNSCDAKHGVLVKSAFGYSCIEQGKH
jgi:uncharacterized membrane protein